MLEFLDNFIGVAVFVGVFALVAYFQKEKAVINKETGEKVVEHGVVYKILSLGLLVGAIFGAVYFYKVPETLVHWVIYWTSSSIGIILAILTIIDVFTSKVYFNDEGIRKVSVWTRNHTIKWGEVKETKYSRILHMYVIKSINGAKIRVDEHMNGCDNLLLELKRRHPDSSFGLLQDSLVNIMEAEDIHENYQEGLYFSPDDGLNLAANFNVRKLHVNQMHFLDGLEYVLTELKPANLDFSKVLYKETKGVGFNEIDIIIPHINVDDFFITLKIFQDNVVVGLCGFEESFNNFDDNNKGLASNKVEFNDDDQPPEFIIDAVNYIGFLIESNFLLKYYYKGENVTKIDLIHIGDEEEEMLGELKPIGLPKLNVFKKDKIVDKFVSFSKTEE